MATTLPAPSSGAKIKLKTIQKHVKSEEWEEVVKASKEVIKEDKGQGLGVYNALNFAGLALTKLERFDEAEKALTQATILAPSLALAYQGLSKLYTEKEQWDKLAELIQSGVIRTVDNQDGEECARQVQRLLELRSQHGTSSQVISVLELLLPSSPIYDLLLSSPAPGTAGQTEDAGSSASTTYVPFPVPDFPPPPEYIPSPPLSMASPLQASDVPTLNASSLPSIPHLVHLPELSFALLITLTLIVEREEQAGEEKEVADRRRRLGAGGEKEVRRAVGREWLNKSKLPRYYEMILNHPVAPDDVRRSAESKLFRHWYRLMASLSRTMTQSKVDQTASNAGLFDPRPEPPLPSKDSVKEKVLEMMKGMILLDVEDEAVWGTSLEWNDAASLDDIDIGFLHRYINHFPSSPTTSLIIGYLRYFDRPMPAVEEDITGATGKRAKLNRRERRKQKAEEWAKRHPEEEMPAEQEEEEEIDEEELFERAQVDGIDGQKAMDDQRKDPFAILVSGLEGSPRSIFGHKAITQAYLREQDYENAIATAEKGQQLVKNLEIENGQKMPNSRAFFDVALGTALVHYYAPKHHERALKLLEGVLASSPDSIPCLLGRGHILEAKSQFPQARADFERVVEITSDIDSAPALEAREEAGWCLVQEGNHQAGRDRLESVTAILDAMKDKAADSARVWWRIGQAEWLMGGDHRETAHTHFVNALRRFPTFASAFTSIGIYYLEQASPPDFDRAQRCFQKAFELDATQAEAARRLVMGLAEEKEWALVDVIAKRVIAGEGGLEGGLSGTGSDTTRFLPTNAWAWKAVGGVEMSYRKYAAAAQAYQIALRVDSEDASLWMRLGEAYAKAGRQAASIKTLQHALVLEPDNWVCNYHMGEVQRQLGLYNEAITSFQHILDVRPEEVGAAIALAECALELGKSERRAGLMARSQASVSRSIECMGGVLRTSRQYRLVGWRVFAEACLELFHTCREDDDVASSLTLVLPLVEILRTEDEDNRAVVAGVTSPAALVAADPHRQSLLLAAICAYAYRADLLKYDKKVSEPPLYDLATALHIMALHLPEDGTHPDQREACIKAATLALKRALDSDPSSPSLWNAFGTVASLGSAQLAQHAFVVSLELEPRNPTVWSNLGFLCLQSGDYEIADDAFSKAQIVSPEHSLAWMGKAMVALQRGEPHLAENLFEQAATLSGGSQLSANLGFADLAYQELTSRGSIDVSTLHQSAFAVRRYCESNPSESAAWHLYALISERLGQHDIAIEALEHATRRLETEFESSESQEVEHKYTVALVNLGRVRLASGAQAQALAVFADALELAGEDARMVVQCHLGQALAQAGLGEADKALEEFQQALNACDSLGTAEDAVSFKEEVSVLLTRTLWSMQDEDAKEAAQAHLLESLSTEHEHSIEAVATLAAVGVLSGDGTLLGAVDSEIEGLNVQRLATDDPSRKVARIQSLRQLSEARISAALRAMAAAVHATPSHSAARSRLAELLISVNQPSEARGVLATSFTASLRDSDEVAGIWRHKALATMQHDPAGAVKASQKAVMSQPWNPVNWKALLVARMDASE